MRNCLSCILLLMLCACEPDLVKDNSRTVVNARVVTTDGAPMSDIGVHAVAGEFESVFIEDQNPVRIFFEIILGSSFTDNQGEVSFISLVGNQRNTERLVLVNYASSFPEIENDGRLQSVVYRLNGDNTEEINLPETVLKPISDFTLNINRASNEATRLSYELSYKDRTSFIELPSGEIVDSVARFGDLNTAETERSVNLRTLQETVVVFTYRIFDEDGLVSSGQEEININQNEQEFEFTF